VLTAADPAPGVPTICDLDLEPRFCGRAYG
jgi:hypothetical protein